jgi:hypothetical protein
VNLDGSGALIVARPDKQDKKKQPWQKLSEASEFPHHHYTAKERSLHVTSHGMGCRLLLPWDCLRLAVIRK